MSKHRDAAVERWLSHSLSSLAISDNELDQARIQDSSSATSDWTDGTTTETCDSDDQWTDATLTSQNSARLLSAVRGSSGQAVYRRSPSKLTSGAAAYDDPAVRLHSAAGNFRHNAEVGSSPGRRFAAKVGHYSDPSDESTPGLVAYRSQAWFLSEGSSGSRGSPSGRLRTSASPRLTPTPAKSVHWERQLLDDARVDITSVDVSDARTSSSAGLSKACVPPGYDYDEDDDELTMVSAEPNYEVTPPVHNAANVLFPELRADDLASLTSDSPSRWSDFVSEDESYFTADAGSEAGVPEELVYRRQRCAGDAAALYRRRLARLEARAARFTPELDSCLRAAPAQLGALEQLEEAMAASLAGAAAGAGPASRRTCFNYLLLDPRVTTRIPGGADVAVAFPLFASAVFYVGKGQQSRPHQHLLEAAAVARGRAASARLQHIRAIWSTGAGVVLLIVFHHRLPDEALTREAAMIDALGLRNLTNVRSGDYYGATKTWTTSQRRRLGAGLLHKALRMYLVEGETQLRPEDLGKDAVLEA